MGYWYFMFMLANGFMAMILALLATFSVVGFYHSFTLQEDALLWQVIFGASSFILLAIPIIIRKKRGIK